MNTLMDLMYWIEHEVIIFLSEPKKTNLTLSSISPFIVKTTTLAEYRCSFISRPDLFCDGKYLIAPTFEASVQRVFKGFLWFFFASWHALLFPWLNQKQDVQKWDPYLF